MHISGPLEMCHTADVYNFMSKTIILIDLCDDDARYYPRHSYIYLLIDHNGTANQE
jgi:hypothetical protein